MRRIWTIARRLRKAATDAERILWLGLRGRRLAGLRFRRHFPIGGFDATFACIEAALVVEIDGGRRVELNSHDAVRTLKLELCGYRVIHFWNDDVLLRTDDVLRAVLAQALAGAPARPPPSPAIGRAIRLWEPL